MSEPKSVKKIILVGEAAVGKTSIRKRFMGKGFKNNYMATIGADFSYYNHEEYKLSIWDLAGEPNYANVRKQYYSGASGVIIVFDITRPSTLQKIDRWIEEFKPHIYETAPYLLVGNKEDLRGEVPDVISEDKVNHYQKKLEQHHELPVPQYYSSAKTGLHIELLFEELVNLMKRAEAQIN